MLPDGAGSLLDKPMYDIVMMLFSFFVGAYVLGYASGDKTGKTMYRLIHPTSMGEMLEEFERAESRKG